MKGDTVLNRTVFKGKFRVTGCFLQSTGYWAPPHAPHRGLDLVGDEDKTVYSPCRGVVEHAGDAGDGFGIYARIRNEDDKAYYLCHMSKIYCKAGQKIEIGDKVGVMGATGNVTGPHTHFEIRDRAGKIYSGAEVLGIPNRQGEYTLVSLKAPTSAVSAPMVHLDTPKHGAVIVADTTITGWAISPNGMARADIYLDGKQYLGSTHTLSGRPDVAAAFPRGYRHPEKSGIVFALPYGKLPKGGHTLCVAGVQETGAPVWAKVDITVR